MACAPSHSSSAFKVEQYERVYEAFVVDRAFWTAWGVIGCAKRLPGRSAAGRKRDTGCIRVVVNAASPHQIWPSAYTPGALTLATVDNDGRRHVPHVALDVYMLEEARRLLFQRRAFALGELDESHVWLDNILQDYDARLTQEKVEAEVEAAQAAEEEEEGYGLPALLRHCAGDRRPTPPIDATAIPPVVRKDHGHVKPRSQHTIRPFTGPDFGVSSHQLYKEMHLVSVLDQHDPMAPFRTHERHRLEASVGPDPAAEAEHGQLLDQRLAAILR